MSFFPNAQAFNVNGGQFTAMTNNYLIGQSGIDILREASAPEAAHDSSARTYSPRCFPGTRQQYVEDIIRHATPSFGDAALPIYWMRGPAGVGKSAIAQTCAEVLQKKGALGASFFFSVGGQHKPEKLFPSIAYQLSTVHPAYRDLIEKKISRDKTLVDKGMQFQFQYLIEEPLRELEESGKGIRRGTLVLIDGLDECEGAEPQCEIIRIVAAAAFEGTIPLRWGFFSRPEPHIETMFSRASVSQCCYKTMIPISRDADGEIELYLRNSFNNILPHRDTLTQTMWPSAEEMNIVVRAAGGLFIYAATVVRFVGRADFLGPQKRLRVIIDVILDRESQTDKSFDAPFAELDAFYMLILQRISTNIFPFAHSLLEILGRHWATSAILAANILELSKDEFEIVWNSVSAVIYFGDSDKVLELDPTIDTNCTYQTGQDSSAEIRSQVLLSLGGEVSFYHKSFYDFLLDPERSGKYCVEASDALSERYTKIHLDYDQTFCWRGSELVLAPGVPNSAASLSYPYTNELVNSLIKIWIYIWAGGEHAYNFPPSQRTGVGTSDRDFRKRLHIFTGIFGAGYTFSHLLWGCEIQKKLFQGVYIDYISHNEFPQFNVTEFKSMIKQQEQAGIIRRLYSTWISWIKSLFHTESQEGAESALYCMGHGEKSIFWYWEINDRLQHYRSFRAIDLAEGERRFQEEDFNSWC